MSDAGRSWTWIIQSAVIAALAMCIAGCQASSAIDNDAPPVHDSYQRPEPALSVAPLYSPRKYSAPFVQIAPVIDGAAGDAAWQLAPWSENFTDIEGPVRTIPSQRTRFKMTWDAKCLYILGELAETDLWATLKTHDEIVFHDNDFEVFIDPDGDTREYYEIEVNAIGTIFDLYLPQPYRAGTKADHSWTAQGMRLAIGLDGTLNDSRDRDEGWRVEMALPWTVFSPISYKTAEFPQGTPVFQRAARPPRVGDHWRMNFSRVQWMLEKDGESYRKVAQRPEDNWTWTPQWMIDMHVPQWWGVVEFVHPAEMNERISK